MGRQVNIWWNWMDTATLGCGWRSFVVRSVGRAKAHLLYIPTLTPLDVDLRTYAGGRLEEVSAARVERRLRDRLRYAKLMDQRFSQTAVTEALLALGTT